MKTFDDARADGQAAFEAGKAPAANPYYRETDYGKAWAEGYEAARAKAGPDDEEVAGCFRLPKMVDYGAAHITTRTRKLAESRFAAIGAIYFMGRRGMYVASVGSSRAKAERAVMNILEPDPGAAYRSERFLRAAGG